MPKQTKPESTNQSSKVSGHKKQSQIKKPMGEVRSDYATTEMSKPKVPKPPED